MAKRLKKSKKKQKINFNKKAINSFFIVFFSFIYLSILTRGFGISGEIVSKFSFYFFGIGSYILFPIIIIHFLTLIFDKGSIIARKRFFFAYLSLLFLLAIIDINSNTGINLKEIINSNLILANKGLGVGLVGSLISYISSFLIGELGTYLLFVILLLFTVLSIINLSLKDFIINMYRTSKKTLNLLIQKVKDFKYTKVSTKKSSNGVKNIKSYTSDDLKQAHDELEQVSRETKGEDFNLKITDYSDLSSKDKQLSMEDYNLKIDPGSTYKFPTLELLKTVSNSNKSGNLNKMTENAAKIEETLDSFNISGKVVQVNRGPRVTSYELQPAGGVKVSTIVNLQDNLALSLASSGIRIEAPIPGKSVVGIEVPNKEEDSVGLKELLSSSEFNGSKVKIPFALGKDISGQCIVTGIEKMPHLLIAGATGSGKSVCINTLIMSILFSRGPEDVKLLLIDPKMVELNVYNGIPHLVIPVVTNPKKASAALNWAVREMERRYELFSNKSVRDIESYKDNYKGEDDEKLPYIVIIIDELSDLMMVAANEVEDHISRLAQMSRACGIHLVIATQRPSVDVITGTIKANVPSRISFSVSSQIDSRTILDMAGAEKLLGKGDMLFYPSSFMKPQRLQGAFISDAEVENVVSYIKKHSSQDYNEEVLEDIKNHKVNKEKIETQDELLKEAIDVVILEGQASVSLIQRRLQVGYARAGRIIDQMQEMGVIEGHQGSKPRRVLISNNILEEGDNDEYSK